MHPYIRPGDCLFSTYTLTSKMHSGVAFFFSEARNALHFGGSTNPVHFSKCTTRFPYKTYGVRKRNLGKSSINRQIQKYVANHNKDGPKTKLKMKKFLTALSSVLYFMFYFPPYVLYGKRVVHFNFEKWTGGGKSTLISFILAKDGNSTR